MTKNNTENSDEHTQKKVAYYSALVNAWIQSRMEVDKTLIIISSAGIGFLVTIITTLGISNTAEFLIFIGAFVSFFIVIVTCIIVLDKNPKYIKSILYKEDNKESKLDRYDKLAKSFFIVALVFTLMIGANYGLKQILNNGGTTMSDESKKRPLDESLAGLKNLDPSSIKKKSLNGLDQLNPDAIVGTGQADTSSDSQDSSSEKE